MPLRTALAKLRREREKAVVVFLIFAFLSLGINFTLGGIGSFMETIDEFSHIGNVELVVQGVGVENLTRFGEVVNYLYFNEGKVKLGGKEYSALIGYGRFDVPKAKSTPDGAYVLAFPEARRGDKIEVNGKTYTVLGSYYYLMGKPIVLTMERGENLYVFMRCNDAKALAEFLMIHARVRYFMVYEKGHTPYMDELGNVRNFVMSFFYLILGTALLVKVLVTMAHIRGSTREVGVLKALGLPDSFIFALFVADYLIVAILGYATGIVPGILLGSRSSLFGVSLPLRPNYTYPIKFDVLIVLAIVLMVSLPYLYVSRIKTIEALRFVPKRSSLLKFLAVFFVAFLASSSAYFALVGVEKLANFNAPFNVWAIGSPEEIAKLPGEKVGYLSGQSVNGITTEIYFFNRTSIFGKTLIKGRWFTGQNEAVIEVGLARKLHVNVGDTIRVTLLGVERTYRVVGISDAFFYNYRALFLPMENFLEPTMDFMKVENPEGVKEKLEAQGLKVYTLDDLRRNIEQNLVLFKTPVYTVMLVTFLVSVFAIFTLIYLEVEGNEKVYATLKAVGIPDSYVEREFLTKVVTSAVIGSFLAIPPAVRVGYYIGSIILPVNLSLGDSLRILPPLPVLYVAYALFTVFVVRRVMGKLDVVKALRA
ncbi:ABC transporter permease [Thermococcus stetteri]|uniref:ABC transporter permease n=1 Tax=Thermococcus stetteri TaxID=49900 RepID=UPI001AE8DABD|nr:FtsX-like permease family protein [Thermococcus stetteri]MBP1911524.1 ABC-type lipoprotein release transport system permease subunit [Thermococcus stetteri]